jgi:hypothetical protein
MTTISPVYGGKYTAVDPYRTLDEILQGGKGDLFSLLQTRMAEGGHVTNQPKRPGTLEDLLRLLK